MAKLSNKKITICRIIGERDGCNRKFDHEVDHTVTVPIQRQVVRRVHRHRRASAAEQHTVLYYVTVAECISVRQLQRLQERHVEIKPLARSRVDEVNADAIAAAVGCRPDKSVNALTAQKRIIAGRADQDVTTIRANDCTS